MKAIVKFDYGKDGVGLRDVPEPVPKEGELKVKVLAAGICGSDIYALLDERKTAMPVILGHEYVGQVTEICGDAGGFNTGDYVVTLPACYSCGECGFCKAGMVTLCPRRKSIGTHVDGAMAEYVVVPAKYSFKVPDDSDNKLMYVLSEPFTCSVRGVYERIDVAPGDVAVVSGPGTIGLTAMAALKTRGAYVIMHGLPKDSERLELALRMGADAATHSYDELESACRSAADRAGSCAGDHVGDHAADRAGPRIVVEAAGHPSSLDICLRIAAVKSKLLQMGYYGGRDIQCRIDYAFDKELDIFYSNSTAMSSWDIGLRLINEKKVDLSPLLSLKLPLSEWRRGFEAVISKEAMKVVFCP